MYNTNGLHAGEPGDFFEVADAGRNARARGFGRGMQDSRCGRLGAGFTRLPLAHERQATLSLTIGKI